MTTTPVPWFEGPLCGFDLETSGTNIETDRIVTACAAELNGDEPGVYNWLADPGVDIPAAASNIHGITTEYAQANGLPAAMVIEDVITELAAQVAGGTPLVIMNAPYDLSLLDREARRYGLKPLTDIVGDELLVIDPKVLDKEVSHRRGKRTLTDLCGHYGVTLDGAHTADADSVGACRVARVIGARYRRLGQMATRELHRAQVGWAAEQAASLADYFRRTPGKEHQAATVRPEWPLIPFDGASA
jgi:DNA polymerase-3 subunit epsilon